MDGKMKNTMSAEQNSLTTGISAAGSGAVADTPPVPDLPPINPALEINLPSFKYFTQVVQPLVFDDSLSLYEVTQKLSALLNANIEQVNALTGGVKDFMENMVKWGQEINAQWVAYQEQLNKAWTDFQGEMNESYNNLVNQWNAYQEDLNGQWAAYKTQLNAEMNTLKSDWTEYKNGMEDDWTQFQMHYEELWAQYKQSIDSTIESQVNTWMNTNANVTITNWLNERNIPGWIFIPITTNMISHTNTTTSSISGQWAYSETLKLVQVAIVWTLITTDPTNASALVNPGIFMEPNNLSEACSIIIRRSPDSVIYNTAEIRRISGKIVLGTGQLAQTTNTSFSIIGSAIVVCK